MANLGDKLPQSQALKTPIIGQQIWIPREETPSALESTSWCSESQASSQGVVRRPADSYVHGKYPASGPNLKLDLLKDLHTLCTKKGVFLVLHGASGLSEELIKESIKHGVRKFNENTEVRKAFMESLAKSEKDLVHVMASTKDTMHLFGSAGKA